MDLHTQMMINVVHSFLKNNFSPEAFAERAQLELGCVEKALKLGWRDLAELHLSGAVTWVERAEKGSNDKKLASIFGEEVLEKIRAVKERIAYYKEGGFERDLQPYKPLIL